MSESQTLTVSISALHMSGLAVSVGLQVQSINAIDSMITSLLEHGYRPVSGDVWARTAEGTPVCPKHRIPMRLRQKQGDEWWSHQVLNSRTGEEVFCRGYPGPNSPGWEVPA